MWVIIALYVSVVYLTLPVMPSVFRFVSDGLGKELLSLVVNGLLVTAILLSLIFILKTGELGYYSLASVSLVMLLSGAVALTMELPAERIHFLEYGILGSLVYKATMRQWKIPILSSFVLVSIIGIGDETIQWFLPNRYAEMKDVLLNCFGGLLGIYVTWLWNGKP